MVDGGHLGASRVQHTPPPQPTRRRFASRVGTKYDDCLPPHRDPHLLPTRLYLYRGWWSAHAPPSAPLTVFTMASMDRLGLLEAQCRYFAGPHVAAVYLPLRVAAEAAEKSATRQAQAAAEHEGKRKTAAVGAVGAHGGGGEEGEGGGVIPGHEALGWLSAAHQEQVRKAERSLQVGARQCGLGRPARVGGAGAQG